MRKCVEEDGAEVVILGGSGFAGLGQIMSERAGYPAIDPVTATFKVMEALLELRLGISKVGMWQKSIPTMFGDRKYVRPFEAV